MTESRITEGAWRLAREFATRLGTHHPKAYVQGALLMLVDTDDRYYLLAAIRTMNDEEVREFLEEALNR